MLAKLIDLRWAFADVAALTAYVSDALPVGADGLVVDLGGGAGGLAARVAAALEVSVIVLDPSAEALRQVPGHPRLSTAKGHAERLPLPDASVDVVLIVDALHHFDDLDAAVAEIARVLKPSGLVLIGEIDPSGWRRIIVWAEQGLGQPAHFVTPEQLARMLERHGLRGSCVRRGLVQYWFRGRLSRGAAHTP